MAWMIVVWISQSANDKKVSKISFNFISSILKASHLSCISSGQSWSNFNLLAFAPETEI
jgi:hypothetical protein